MAFRSEGDVILLLHGDAFFDGRSVGSHGGQIRYFPKGGPADLFAASREFSSSEYARTIHGIESGAPPAVNLAAEKRLIAALVALAAEGKLQSAHDVGDGGLAVTIAESCFASSGLSAQILHLSKEPDESALFGERGARAVVSVTPENVAAVRRIAAQYEVAAVELGRVTRGEFRIDLNGRTVISADLPHLADAWSGALERLLS
jgi:phosphoribosylformylglycinamidine synthase